MKSIEKLVKENSEVEQVHLDKIIGDEFEIGDKVCWIYKDDIKFEEDEEEFENKVTDKNFSKYASYAGIVVGLEGREVGTLDSLGLLYDSFICVTDYPTQKCYPDVDWVSVGQIVKNPDLVYFGLKSTAYLEDEADD